MGGVRLLPLSSVILCAVTLVTLSGCSFQAGLDVEPAAGTAPADPSVGFEVRPGGSPTTTPSSPSATGTTVPPSTAPGVPSSPATTTGSTPSGPRTPVSTPGRGTTTGASVPTGAGSAPTSVPPTTPPTTSAPVTACTTGQLVAAVTVADAPPGSSTASGTVSLTNIGRSTCRLKGFGGIALSRGDGTPVLSGQQRTSTPATTVTLAPGKTARSTITWSTVANTAVGEPATGDCEPVPTALLVIPPDQIADLAVPWTAGPVCDQGSITQGPYA